MRCVPSLPLGYPESPFVLRFNPEELRAQPVWSNRVDAILIPQEAAPAVRTGAKALRTTLANLGLGSAVLVEMDPTCESLPENVRGEHLIVMGCPGGFALATALAKNAGLTVTDERLNGDGFIIKPVMQAHREILLITSSVARGVLYGAYELEERTQPRGVPRIDQCFVPTVRYRGWPLHIFVDEPRDCIGRWRLNLSNASDWGAESTKSLLFYKDFPELGGERYRERILRQQLRLHEKYANAIEQGAMPMITWNPLSFTLTPGSQEHQVIRETLSRAHPGILASPYPSADRMAHLLGADRQNLCPSDPVTRQLVASAVREFVETFPEVELVHFSLTDLGGELLCGCEKCRHYPFLDRVTDYAELIMKTARGVKPTIRFIMCPSALMYLIPAHHPEFPDEVAALKELKRRLGPGVEAFSFSVGTPPGGDCQSWLAPDSSMLGQGVPLVTFFQHYEADGPGIVSPLSNIISHLSWSLPIHLRTLKRYAAGGMIGALGQGAGLEVGYWHPELDGRTYLENWCQARYGRQAGRGVFQALQDTHKVTEAFYLETKPDSIESIDFYRWGAYLKPWATDMNALAEAGLTKDETARVIAYAALAFTVPQAPLPEGLRMVGLTNQDAWLKRFELAEAIAIADRSERILAMAMNAAPDDSEIAYLHAVAAASRSLVRFFRDYHLALVYVCTARNTPDSEVRQAQIELSRRHLVAAIGDVAEYRDIYLPLVRRQNDALVSLKYHAPAKYVGTFLALVREAAYLFDGEFGGDSLVDAMDHMIASPAGSRRR
jgi:hypothetical protein